MIQDAEQLRDLIAKGETSTVQFNENVYNERSIAQEMVAFTNSKGGTILIGVDDKTWEVKGLSDEDIRRLTDLLVNAANEHVKSPIFITTATIVMDGKKVVLVEVPEGTDKPYKDKDGIIFMKNGANKREVTSNEEISRLLQSSRNMQADEMEIAGTSIADIEEVRFAVYFKKEFGQSYQDKGLTYEQALKAKRVLRNGRVTLAGLLFFGEDPQSIRPALTVRAAHFYGNDAAGHNYRNKLGDIRGTLPELYDRAMGFLLSSLIHRQSGESFNSPAELEVAKVALEELLLNALIHRDYFKNAPVRLFIFDNRIEIISPGCLPNSLTVEDIKFGNPVIRNNQIVAFSQYTMRYSGLGTGIKRALQAQPDILLINDTEGEQFIVQIPRPEGERTDLAKF